MIKLVERKNIDDSQWNSVIAASKHETIYPYTWYLDVSADQWLGLIMNDYEYIMPLAYRKKYTIKYVYQPFHTQQLGVFSEKQIDGEILNSFIAVLQQNFRMADYGLNAGNCLSDAPEYELKESVNYVLSLKEDYEHLYGNYLGNVRRNLRKACKVQLQLSENLGVEEFVKLKQQTNPSGQDTAFFQNMQQLLNKMEKLKKIRIFGVYFENELGAAGVFALSSKKVIYLLSGSNELGKKHSMMFFLLDSVIRMYSGQDLLFDFEGSNVPSIAEFFEGFGPKKENYQRLHYNRLPIVGRKK